MKSRLPGWVVGVVWLVSLAALPTVRALELTDAERDWLKAHPTIKVGYDPHWPPFSTRGPKGFMGIDADILSLLEKRLGIKFTQAAADDWQEVYAQALRREVDVLVGMARNEERATQFRFTDSYLYLPVGIITRADRQFYWSVSDLAGKIVAGPRNYVVTEAVRRDHPEVKVLHTRDMAEALESVSDGRADVAITNLINASYLINERRLTNLKISGVMPDTFELRYAVRPDWPELVSILNKTIATLSPQDLQALTNRWVKIGYLEPGFWGRRGKWTLAVLIGAGLVAAFLGWHRVVLRRELRKAAAQSAAAGPN